MRHSPPLRRLPALLLLPALLSACGESPVVPVLEEAPALGLPVANAVTSNTWTPLSLVVQKCGSEAVPVTGVVHEMRRDRRDANDGVHVGYHLNFLLKGESSAGVKYHYSANQNSQTYLRFPSKTDVTELRVRMRAQGNADDLIFILRIHFVMDANGEIHVDYRTESEECGRGASGGTPSV